MADDQPEGSAVMSMEDTMKEQGSMMTETGEADTDVAVNTTDTNATDTGNETGTNSTG
jgi:hypothetical protein